MGPPEGIDTTITPLPAATTAGGWRPWPLRRPFLLGFAVLCLLLIVAIEVVLGDCRKNGCHVFGERSVGGHLSGGSNFAYNQFPTILGLCLSLLWALPHHDIMRLEPYFQMSAEGGATAKDSLFLQYPYTFPPLVPYFAGKSKHFVVLLSAFVILLMNLVITPLIAGVFDETFFEESIPGNGTRGKFTPGPGGDYNLTAGFAAVAYDHAWLGGTVPAYTTREYALLPVLSGPLHLETNETWIADTTILGATLTCESAASPDFSGGNGTGIISSRDGAYQVRICDPSLYVETNSVDATTGNGCDVFTSFATPWTNIFTEVKDNDGTVRWDNGSGLYLVAWASGAIPLSSTDIPVPTNITALFCMTSYYSQPVTAIFTMPAGQVQNVSQTGSRQPFTHTDNFERVIYGHFDAFLTPDGLLNTANDLVALGYIPRQLPNVDSQLQRRLGVRPENILNDNPVGLDVVASHSLVYMNDVHGIRGFALSDVETPDQLGELLDPQRLTQAYERALQMLFSFAVTMDMVDIKEAETVPVIRKVIRKGFTMDHLSARVSQGGLAAVVLMVLALAVLMGRRPCNLDGEPNSIAVALRLLFASPEMNALFENSEFATPDDMFKVFKQVNGRFSLQLDPERGPRIVPTNVQQYPILPAPDMDNRKPWAEKLWPLRIVSGVGFVVFFAVVAVLLVVAYGYSRQHNGLPMVGPTTSFRYKLLFSYIPIVLSTAIEPILVSLGSAQCMLGPYTSLSQSGTMKSMVVDFDRSPPHYQLLLSLRTGDIALGALTISILLSNVLAVAFSGLFSTNIVNIDIERDVYTRGAPMIQGNFTVPAEEMYFLLAEDLSDKMSPPNWTTPEYYVIPFLPEGNDMFEKYQGPTIGIGVDVECTLVEPAKILQSCNGSNSIDVTECTNGRGDYYFSIDDPCWGYMAYGDSITEQVFRDTYFWGGVNFDSTFSSANCSDTIFAVWAELPANPAPDLSNQTSPYLNRLDAVALKCSSMEKVVHLTADVDIGNKIQSTTDIRPLDNDVLANFYPPNTNGSLAATFISVIRTGLNSENSVDNHRIRWFNNLITTIKPSIVRKLTNITHIPDTTHLADVFEDVYRRVFAINLHLYADDIIFMGEESAESGTAIVRRERVHVSTVMFSLAAAILIFNIGVLSVLYWGPGPRRKPVGHLPKNLAGTYALLYASNAKEECGLVTGRNHQKRAKELEKLNGRYSYGEFDDGRHFGVYREVVSGGSPAEPNGEVLKEMGVQIFE